MVACLFTSIFALSQKKATEMSGISWCGNGDGHEHGCLDALAISLSSVSMYKHLDFQLVTKRLKEAELYSAEDLAMAGRGNILPESVIGQLLPADADEASREALNVIFDVGRQALLGSMRLCLRQLQNKQGIRGANWYGQLLSTLSCEFVQHVSHASLSSAESTVTVTGLQRRTSLSQCPPCRFQPSVQKVVRICFGGGEMFPVSGRIGYTLSSVQFVFLSAPFGQYFADAEVC